MRILICFDTDGVFHTTEDISEYVRGPIDVEKLLRVLYQWHIGNLINVVVVSESPFYPKNKDGSPVFEIINNRANRLFNLLEAKKKYPSDLYLYISDNGWDKDYAKNAGFIYVTEQMFADMLGVRHVEV